MQVEIGARKHSTPAFPYDDVGKKQLREPVKLPSVNQLKPVKASMIPFFRASIAQEESCRTLDLRLFSD